MTAFKKYCTQNGIFNIYAQTREKTMCNEDFICLPFQCQDNMVLLDIVYDAENATIYYCYNTITDIIRVNRDGTFTTQFD